LLLILCNPPLCLNFTIIADETQEKMPLARKQAAIGLDNYWMGLVTAYGSDFHSKMLASDIFMIFA